MTNRRYTRAIREGDDWTARTYDGERCVAVVTSTISAEDAERAAAKHAGVEWQPLFQGNGWEAMAHERRA